jgi:hypothetical protein
MTSPKASRKRSFYQRVDDAFYEKVRSENGGNLPVNLIGNGGKPRKLTNSPQDRAYRRQWLALASSMRNSRAVPQKKVTSSCIPCAANRTATQFAAVMLPSKHAGELVTVGKPKQSQPPSSQPEPAISAIEKIKGWWRSGKPALEIKKNEAEAKIKWEKEPDSISKSWGEKDDDDPKTPEIGVEYTWIKAEGALKQFGDDKNNFQLGAYEAELTSGIKKVKGGYAADLISGSAEFDAAKVSGQKDLLGGVADVKGEAEVLSAKAEANIGVEYSDKKKAIEADVGAEANLAKAEVSGEFNIPLPFHHVLSLGGTVEGKVGAAAKAQASAGWTADEGYVMTAGAKLAVGLGLGAGFKIGFK